MTTDTPTLKSPLPRFERLSKADWASVMVDLETTGTQPDRHGILQIAAVRFDLMTMEIDGADTFQACLTLPTHRHWMEDTRRWWLKDKRELLEKLMNQQEEWVDVLKRFQAWVGPSKPQFWSKPVSFDFMFLSSYFADAGLANPFHYRYANDLNSFMRGMYFPRQPPHTEWNVKTEGEAHDALNDVFHQLHVLFKNYDEVRK